MLELQTIQEKKKPLKKKTGNYEWYTPTYLLECARNVLGEIELDPASCAKANERVRANRYYTADDDGAKLDWRGRVWCNPPFSRTHIRNFTAQFVREYRNGNMAAGILLCNSQTDTVWYQKLLVECHAVCFHQGEIRFHKNGMAKVCTVGMLCLLASSANFG